MDNYQIDRIVGRGGFGTVYLCVDKKTFKNVIIKQIPLDQMTSIDRQVSSIPRMQLSIFSFHEIFQIAIVYPFGHKTNLRAYVSTESW